MPRRAIRKCKLTELYVRKLKPAAAAFVVWDTHQRGLGLKVMPTGAMSWKAVYSRGGRPRWMHLGAADAIPLAGARELAAAVMFAVAKGADPAAEKRAQRSSGTFGDLARRYLEQHAKRHNKSWRQANALVRRGLLPYWGKLQASLITRADVKAMMARATAPIAANQTLAAASAIFTWANKEDLIAGNPCRGIDRNPTSTRERVLSAAEVPQFWAAFDTAGLVAGSALKMLLLVGQRPGEVARMRYEHIVDGGWWEMPGKPAPDVGWLGTKNAQSHRVWLPAPARALIEELTDGPKDKGFVFTAARGRSVSNLDAAMRAVCKAIAADRATPHDLRRTHGTTIAALGYGRDAMNRIQNHRDSGIASVYDRHRYADEDKRIMETVAARIMALAEGRSEDDKVIPIRR